VGQAAAPNLLSPVHAPPHAIRQGRCPRRRLLDQALRHAAPRNVIAALELMAPLLRELRFSIHDIICQQTWRHDGLL